MVRDTLKGMIAAANSFKNSPPRIPNSFLLEDENRKYGEITRWRVSSAKEDVFLDILQTRKQILFDVVNGKTNYDGISKEEAILELKGINEDIKKYKKQKQVILL